jgi:hypothetical protein
LRPLRARGYFFFNNEQRSHQDTRGSPNGLGALPDAVGMAPCNADGVAPGLAPSDGVEFGALEASLGDDVSDYVPLDCGVEALVRDLAQFEADGEMRRGMTSRIRKIDCRDLQRILLMVNQYIPINARSTFLQLGSCCGEVVLQVAASSFPFALCVGTEAGERMWQRSGRNLINALKKTYLQQWRTFFAHADARYLSYISPFTHVFFLSKGLSLSWTKKCLQLVNESTTAVCFCTDIAPGCSANTLKDAEHVGEIGGVHVYSLARRATDAPEVSFLSWWSIVPNCASW